MKKSLDYKVSVPLLDVISRLHPIQRTIVLAHLDAPSTATVVDSIQSVLNHRFSSEIQNVILPLLQKDRKALRAIISQQLIILKFNENFSLV